MQQLYENVQARLDIVDETPLQAYATVFGRALRSLHAARRSDKTVAKPQCMRAFQLTSRQYNAVKFSLDGMESSIVALRPHRIADLQARIKAIDVKLAKLRNPKSAHAPSWPRSRGSVLRFGRARAYRYACPPRISRANHCHG